jgi:transposase
MSKSISSLPVSIEQRSTLEAWIRAHNTPQSVALRAKIVLLAGDGLPNVRIAQQVGLSRPTVILWRRRFLEGGPEAIATILPGRGRPVTYTTQQVQRIVEATTQTKPPGATQLEHS